ncbi:hypothetical protein AB0O07_03135 [Streptomyces sp. NPDC093085]|uniref:hypothetical protein n=1 Tax=Streptomyces sp. NPDC093085 TaxID=3155068 RepID=UPI003417DB79
MPMRSAPAPAQRATVAYATAAHRAAVRRAVVVALLVLVALLGLSFSPCSAAVRAAAPQPPVSGTSAPSDPGGDGQQDTAETDQHTDPARTERPVRARVEPPALAAPYGARPAPYPSHRLLAGPPRAAGSTRCVVLRC